ncbi:neural-cadherin-like [Palaemon carinicauda]|uniref:neural-cadherin-like n=1 Tax=Palaemon carinicauda TaxID=392227 RepID=UPI0035B63972
MSFDIPYVKVLLALSTTSHTTYGPIQPMDQYNLWTNTTYGPRHCTYIQALRYSFDSMASGDVRQKFALKTNGELWTTEPLDREAFKPYKIPIKVSDGVPAHERMTIYWITVQDLNDVPPVFDYLNGIYEVELPENREVGKSTGIKLAINDSDVASILVRPDGFQGRETKICSQNERGIVDDRASRQKSIQTVKIPIKVSDGVPAHERMTIYWITVQDLNDVPPVFDYLNGIYEVELPENREVGKSTGIKLAINDSDVDHGVYSILFPLFPVNVFEYQIVDGNGEQKFRIDEPTGDILVNKVLDYDHPVYDQNFTLRVRVYDGANPPAETNVIIAVTNVNDLQPVFEQINYTFTVTENTDCNITFGKVSALDPDLPHTVNQNILYYLSPVELRNFTIDSKTGDLSLKGCLDRESAKRGVMTLYPRANDEGERGHDADPATVHVIIRDLNDNHLHIHRPENSYASIMENMDPEDVRPINIKLNDDDGCENGCPCTLEFDPGTPTAWLEKFSLVQIDGGHSRNCGLRTVLSPLVSLDREQQKVYPLPFVTQDQKGRRGIRLFTLEVGDENDSPMSDGKSNIKVYNYQGQFPSMVIGAVYVTDLDDYDLGDKIFQVDATTSSDVANHFQVNLKGGNITMLKGTPAGIHLLRVKVYDRSREESAVGEVTITVVDLNLNAVMNSGSLMLASVRSHQMLKRNTITNTETLYERLKDQIGKIHKIPRNNVDLFTMLDVEDGVQIRYNCHSSPYYTTAKLDGLMMKNRLQYHSYQVYCFLFQVSKALGVDVTMVDINSCLYESKSPCGGKSCQHTMRPNLTSPLVVASSTATMVGVDITDEYTCDCGELEPLPSVCFSGFCYNGGTCVVINNTLRCQCIDNHNYGPRCELKNARF